MVEGVPVCGMAWSFAGPRENVNLGRSVGWQRVSSPAGSRTDDTGRPEAAEEGNLSACAHRHACTGREMLEPSHAPAVDTSFARSSDTCRSVATSESLRGNPLGGGALESVSRSGNPGESQAEPAPGPSRADPARLAVSHHFRQEVRVRHQNGKGVMALVPARITRARGSCPHVVCSCRSRQATPGLKEARQTRLKKGGRGVVNGDLDPRGPRRSHVEDSRTVEAANRPPRSASDITERPREKAQGDVRASSSGCRARRKAGAKVAGPGL
jgi:hypothetical protein